MKTLNYFLLIFFIFFQPTTAQAGFLSSFLKVFERSTADLISGTKPVARSSARFTKKDGSGDGSGQERKDDSSRPIPLQLAGDDNYHAPIPGPLKELPRQPNRIEFPPSWDPKRLPRAQRVPVPNPVARPSSESLQDILKQLKE